MEWIILLLLVPAIVVPVVLLFGFAGCDEVFNLEREYNSPTELTATAISASAIDLAWINPNQKSVKFRIERTKSGETVAETFTSFITTYADTALEEATTYFYRVAAIGISDGETSGFGDAVSATTLTTQPIVFDVTFAAALATNQTGLEGYCIVQRIEPLRLFRSGSQVILTVRGSTVAPLAIDRIFISQAAAPGDPQDSAADLTQVAGFVAVPSNTALALPPIAYNLDHTRPLLIAFDISAAPGTGNVRYLQPVPNSDAFMYYRQATAEAAVANRQSSYGSSNAIYLVERIEVA